MLRGEGPGRDAGARETVASAVGSLVSGSLVSGSLVPGAAIWPVLSGRRAAWGAWWRAAPWPGAGRAAPTVIVLRLVSFA
jgi:hypothetical protein